MDDVLRQAGDCGRFHACHIFFTQLPRFVTVWAVFLMMFGSYNPGWRCVRNTKVNTSSYGNGLNDTLRNTHSPRFDSSHNDGDGNSDNVTKVVYRYDGECDVYDTCAEIEFNTDSDTVLSRFQLVCDRAWIVKLIFILQGVGFFIGALLGGQVGEKFGRKIGLYSSTCIVCVSSGLAIFSPHWGMYAVCIFFVGLGANGVISLTAVFSVEFLNSKWRGYFGSLPTWNISLLIFTITTAAVKNWVYVHLITFIISFVSCVGFLVVVESPRWLLMNGRPQEAEDAIRKIARINGKPPPNFDSLLQLQADRKNNDREGKSYTYIDLFRTKEIRTATLKLSLLMGIFGIVYYAFGWGIQSLPGNFYVNAVASSVLEILNLFIVGPLCNRAGRRKAGVLMALVGAISCLSIVVALFATENGSTLQSTIIKAFAFQGKAAAQSIFAINSLFIVELLPTVVRNVGIGFCRCVAGLGTLVAPFLIPSSDVISFAICFAVLCVFYVIEIAVFLSLPETNNLDLKDSLLQSNVNNEITVTHQPGGDHGEEKDNGQLEEDC